MKLILKPLAVIAIAFSVMTACSKGHTGLSGMTGEWREMVSTGGIGGGTTHFDHELRILRLNMDSTWSFRLSDTLTISGVYSLSTVIVGNKPTTQITYRGSNGGYMNSQTVEMESGQLILTDNSADGYRSVFLRWLL